MEYRFIWWIGIQLNFKHKDRKHHRKTTQTTLTLSLKSNYDEDNAKEINFDFIMNFQGFFPFGIIEIYTIYTIDPIGKYKTIEYWYLIKLTDCLLRQLKAIA